MPQGGALQRDVLTGLEYPKGLWVKNDFVYLTETAGRNTSFGGKVRLLRYEVTGQQLQELLNNPENSDAVVVDDAGSIYLTSYASVIPGDNGKMRSSVPIPKGAVG